jgi:hypothetical protein
MFDHLVTMIFRRSHHLRKGPVYKYQQLPQAIYNIFKARTFEDADADTGRDAFMHERNDRRESSRGIRH